MMEIPEMLDSVLRNLDARSLSRCSRVCRSWYAPSTELMWAQSTKLELLVSRFVKEELQSRFRSPTLRYLATRPVPGFSPMFLGEQDGLKPSESDLDQAMRDFKALPIDWPRELELFKHYSQGITQLNLSSKSLFATRILYVLQQYRPTVLENILPRLKSIVFSGDLYPAISTSAITSLPSIRHITFEVHRFGPSLKSWIQACQPASHLLSLALVLKADKREDEIQMVLDFSGALRGFLYGRNWKELELPGRVVRSSLIRVLSTIESLETLTLHGQVASRQKGDMNLGTNAFKSLRTLRMIGLLGDDQLPSNVAFARLENLVLEFARPTKGKEEQCPVQYLAVMVRSCPRLINLEVSIPGFENSEATGLTDLSFEPLLALSHLQRLVVRTSRTVPICLTDEFLSRAAHAWPELQDLDVDIVHSSQTLLTLQGLAPLAHHCPKLHLLRIGLRPKHVNTVFSPELYGPEMHESKYICVLKYLDIGCPSVYGSEAVSSFLSTIFPHLRYIECPEPGNYEHFSEGDYFVWCQVIKMVHNRVDKDNDIDGLARMLRAQDIRKNLEAVEKGSSSYQEDLVQSSDYDSDDYWAYSGSEDDSYSDSDSD